MPTAVVPYLLARRAPGDVWTRMVIGSAFMIFSGIFIEQAHGMVEAHFHVFVSLAFLLMYRDWIVPVTAAAVIAVHHVGMHILQGHTHAVTLLAGSAVRLADAADEVDRLVAQFQLPA